jgi:hypothetical protein
MATVDNYLGNGSVVVSNTLVTAYDFLSDSGNAINSTLSSQGVTNRDDLISDGWGASQLVSSWPGAADTPELVSVNAHFEHWLALPAVTDPLFYNTDILNGNVSNQIAYSMGCHAGLSVFDDFVALPGDTASTPDFPQAMAEKGAAAWVANTGYGYGMDDAITHSEDLYLKLTQQLGSAAGKPVGQALVEAKQRYLGDAAAAGFGVYDEKAMIEATLYGLPMTTVTVPSPQLIVDNPAIAVTADPDETAGGVITRDINLGFTHTLEESFYQTTSIGNFYSLAGEVFAGPGRPIEPSGSISVSPPDGFRLQGLLWLGGAFTDTPGFDPVMARPLWDIEEQEPDYSGPGGPHDQFPAGWFPNKIWAANRFGDQESIVVVSGQFNKDGDVQRLFSGMILQAVFSPVDNVDFAPPSILYAGSREVPSGLEFLVGASDEEGVARVVVTYQDGTGSWISKDLALVDGIWRYTEPGLAEDTEFFVQACDVSGNCSAKLDKNEYLVGSPPPQFINQVGDSHTFWVAVWKDPGTGLVPAEGVFPTVTLIDRNGDPVPYGDWDGTCKTSGTNAAGKCNVTIDSGQPGPISISATASIEVLPGLFVTRSTDGEIGNSLDATKLYVDATLELADSGLAPIGDDYTVTATVMENVGQFYDENDPTVGYEPAEGVEVTFAISGPTGSLTIKENTCEINATNGTTGTDANGQCTLTFTSSSAGTFQIVASSTVDVEGLPIVLSANSVSVSFVTGSITLQSAFDSLEINDQQTLTAYVSSDDGGGPVEAQGVTVIITLTDTHFAASVPNGGSCSTPVMDQGSVVPGQYTGVTDAAGECTLNFSSASAGTVTASASADLIFNGTTIPLTSDDVVMTFVSDTVTILPDGETRAVDDAQTFTVTVSQNSGDGTGDQPVPGVVPTVTFPGGAPNSTDTTDCESGTDAGGQCTIVVNSSVAGTFTAQIDVDVDGEGPLSSKTRTADVTYVDANASVVPASADNSIDEAHTFTVTVKGTNGNTETGVSGVVPSYIFYHPSDQPAGPTAGATLRGRRRDPILVRRCKERLGCRSLFPVG